MKELRVIEFNIDDWAFQYPKGWDKYDKLFHDGLDCYHHGESTQAEHLFRRVLTQCPIHIDAYHHLRILNELHGRRIEAVALTENALKICYQLFPPRFSLSRSRLRWGVMPNRPFLRTYEAHGLDLLRANNLHDALSVFENMVSMNPTDNQGARYQCIKLYFEQVRPERVLSLCREYPDDTGVEITYGKALALLVQQETDEAAMQLRDAIGMSPRVARELLSLEHKKPKPSAGNLISVGGPEEAYKYWEDYGKFWNAVPGALKLLKDAADGIVV